MTKSGEAETERLRQHLRLANAALKTAISNVEEANKNVKWARQKLIEAEEQNRVLRRALVASYEAPAEEEVERIINALEKSCGFISQRNIDDAANLIRSLWRTYNAPDT